VTISPREQRHRERMLKVQRQRELSAKTKPPSRNVRTINNVDPYAVLAGICKSHGMLSLIEANTLIETARTLPFGALAVVIGAACGTATIALLMARPDIEVVSIDLVDAITERFHARELGFSARLTQIQDNSYTIEWDGPQVDLLFVDGCHTYDCVKKDIAAWLPRMKPDGVVCFHDYGTDDSMWLYVKRAVDEDMAGQEQIYQVGCSIAFSLGAKQ